MKRNKKLSKIIMGGVGFAMAVIVFFVGSMQSMQEVEADIRVFDKITEEYPYGDDKEFKLSILEIVPDNVEGSKEIGYFLTNQNDNLSPTMVTRGSVHGIPSNPPSSYWDPVTNSTVFPDSPERKSYKDSLYQMRMYGMIRPTGPDTNGSYPIYALYNGAGVSVFSNYQNAGCTNAYDQSYTLGVYEMAAGDYNLKNNFIINDEGYICRMVSANSTVSGGSISNNEPTIELIPVTDIDLSDLSLPKSEEYGQLITQVAETDVGKGVGNVKFTRSETSTDKKQYYGLSDQQLYYRLEGNTKFQSSSYFKEYVLGSRDKYANKQITYNTVKASGVTTEQIAGADLVYISGKSVDFAVKNTDGSGNDISEEILLELYNQEVNNHKAILMDYACYSSDAKTNVSKLAMLLWRESQSDILSNYSSSFEEETDNQTGETKYVMQNLDFLTDDAIKDIRSSMMSGANGNFVAGNVYVYNHHMSDFDSSKSMVDAGDIFANGDFNSMYKASVVQQGFTDVLSYITTTNKSSTTGSMLPSVTPAVAIQYILISDGRPLTIVKSTLNVLEIQPVTAFLFNETRGSEEYGYLDNGSKAKTNRENFVLNYLGNYYGDKVEYVNFTSMTVDEFNGRNDDLIETYDIIYIGSETTNETGCLYYTDTLKTRKVVNNRYSSTETEQAVLPAYNDTNMNGMVYYNIGDYVSTVARRTWAKPKADLFGHLEEKYDADKMRYNGRDLTQDKLNKLKLFLDAEGLVLVAGDMMAQDATNNTKINPTAVAGDGADVDHGRVDTSSKMYEFLMYSQGYLFNEKTGVYENKDVTTNTSYGGQRGNLVSVRDISSGAVKKADLEKYIATEKLALTVLTAPTEYAYTTVPGSNVIDEITYMEEIDGKKQLVYDFIVTAQGAGSDIIADYTPTLYVDVNKDGKYSKISESIRDVQIVVKASGAEAARDAKNNYVIQKDVEYRMTRQLDDAFSGYLQWKLNIQSNADPNVHASEEGCTVVKHKDGAVETIKILQITKDDGGTLNLDTEMDKEGSVFGTYLKAVPGYKVVIKAVTKTEFVNDFNKAYTDRGNGKSVEEFAMEYFDSLLIDEGTIVDEEADNDDVIGANMLVFGYGDNFDDIADENAIRALKKFIESDKPVLVAHDFMHYNAKHTQSSYLRQLMGADKYGVTQNVVGTIGKDAVTFDRLVNKNVALQGEGENYLYSGQGYSRSANAGVVQLLELTGKNVAYDPSYKSGTERQKTSQYTQGISNYTMGAFSALAEKDANGNDFARQWLNSPKVVTSGKGDPALGRGSYIAEKINNGQITSYPYLLPDEFSIFQTHAQHLALDLDADDDADGESDVVVWYALTEKQETVNADGTTSFGYNGDYDAYADDAAGPIPADGYYVYNKGNITYTGYGDDDDVTGFTHDEAQLFVNTLFAAFNADQTAPTAGFYETAPGAKDLPIESLAIPFDENVSKNSSVLKKDDDTFLYQFVNPNESDTSLKANADTTVSTPIYYRLDDSNFVRGKKYLTVEYYLKAEGDRVSDDGLKYRTDNGAMRDITKININNTDISVIDISKDILTYQVSEGRFANVVYPEAETSKLSMMESGVVYGFYLPMSYLLTDSHYTIYIKTTTKIVTDSSQGGESTVINVKGEGYSELTVTKTDLLDLD